MDSALLPAERVTKKSASAAIFGAFVVSGVVTTLLGPILPILISRWTLTDEQAGAFFFCQFGTSMAGVVSVGALIPRWGYKATLAAGYVAIALGVGGLNSPRHVGGLVATCLYGYGLGLVIPASNIWVAETTGSARVSALSILNFAWGVGAIASSPLIAIAQSNAALPILLCTIAGFALASAVILTAMHPEVGVQTAQAGETGDMPVGWTTTVALGALFFLYVGAENSVAGWVAALAKRMGTSPHNLWALAPMFFWGGLLAGRGLVPLVPLRRRERLLVATGLSMALAGCAILLAAKTFAGIVLCVALSGLGFAAVYPVLVAWMAKHFGERARRVGSLMFALSGLGGAIVPWLVGLFSTHLGSLQAGLLAPVAVCVVMIALLLLIPRQVAS